MSRLARLYPHAWRERYLAEFDDLLTERPPNLRDQFDLIRGALDAWLHPQVIARATQQESGTSGSRLLAGAAAVIGGGLWIAGGLAMNATQVDQALGYKESYAAVMVQVGGAVCTALAAIALATSASEGSRNRWVAVVMLVGALLIATPWPLLMFGFFGYVVATVVFGFRLAKASDRPLGVLLSITALILTSFNTEDERALLAIPFGLAWIAVGALALRRAPAVTAA